MWGLLITIVLSIIFLYCRYYWSIVISSFMINFLFLGFQVSKLIRVRKCIKKIGGRKKQQANNFIQNINQYQNKQRNNTQTQKTMNTTKIQETNCTYFPQNNPLFKYFHKIMKLIHTSNIAQNNQDYRINVQAKIKEMFGNVDKCKSQGINTANVFDNNTQMKNIQQKDKVQYQQIQFKSSYIAHLIFNQFRQYIIFLSYFIFFVFLVGYNTLSLKILTTEDVENILIQMISKLQDNFLIFILPIIFGMLWRVQRVNVLFMKDSNIIQKNDIEEALKVKDSYQIGINITKIGMNTKQKPSQPISKNNEQQTKTKTLFLSSLQCYTTQTESNKFQIQHQNNVELLKNLIHLQSATQLLVLFYYIISTYIQMLIKLISLSCSYFNVSTYCSTILTFNASPIQSPQKISLQTQIFNILHLIVYKLLLLLILLSYISIKYRKSQIKKPGLKRALWMMHLQLDKILQYISNNCRRKYHNCVYGIIGKLRKYKMIDQSQESHWSYKIYLRSMQKQDESNYQGYGDIMSYYECV